MAKFLTLYRHSLSGTCWGTEDWGCYEAAKMAGQKAYARGLPPSVCALFANYALHGHPHRVCSRDEYYIGGEWENDLSPAEHAAAMEANALARARERNRMFR